MNGLSSDPDDDPTSELETLSASAGPAPDFEQVAEEAQQIQQIGELEARNRILQSELDFKNELIDRYREEIKSLQLMSVQTEGPRVTADPPINGRDVQIRPAEMWMLVGVKGDESARYTVKPGLTSLGSGPDNDIQLKNDFVSRHHAQIIRNADGSVICDLNSTNGTFVNANRIRKHSLQEGDALVFGTLRFKFVMQPNPASDESPEQEKIRL